ncbi:MAG: exonuclease domain-containing protein [Flavobacteriaceae bacterium]|jgi:DNA polymerase-3 subunit epsilon|nr:exonuclease domain-containing protein [bacterium]MDG1052782.1 exonuclease domain-containing protein [Flavobacteriaceae bacterium]|tara:strand:+ start:661 stop:1434 length:774 start_codon:yes stop_codon:yes gene_type:complete
MNLKISKPICFFDLETTGVNVSLDRIVEISILKIFPNGNKESKTWLVNPGVPIPLEASNIHGITNDIVKNEPLFKMIASDIKSMINNCDLAGFNSNKFDIPLLAEELLRSEIDFSLDNVATIDVQNIFHKMEQRTLSAAYQFYCGKSLDNAHSSKADTLATYEVLESQIEKYDDLENNVSFLSDFSKRGKNVDLAGFIKYNEDNIPCFSFGKHKGKTVDYVLENESGYFGWLLNADFPMYTKKVLTQIRLNKLNNKL